MVFLLDGVGFCFFVACSQCSEPVHHLFVFCCLCPCLLLTSVVATSAEPLMMDVQDTKDTSKRSLPLLFGHSAPTGCVCSGTSRRMFEACLQGK